jgi:predicted dehydrogenase
VELFGERAQVTLEGDWWGPVEWQTRGQEPLRLEGEALQAEAARRGAALGNPDGLFVAAVAAGKPAWPSFAEARRAHVLADAVYRSAASGGGPVAC